MRVREEDATRRELVDVRGVNPASSTEAVDPIVEIVDSDKENVRRITASRQAESDEAADNEKDS